MALVKNDLLTAMIDGVKDYPDGGANAMKALGKAIEDYLVNNTDCTYSWVGANSSGTADTTVSFNAELEASGEDFSCTPEDFDGFISDLATFIGKIKINAPSGFTLTSLKSGKGTFTASQIGELEDEKDVDKAMKSAYGEIAQGILDGWKSYFMASATGTHSEVYTGTATLTTVA